MESFEIVLNVLIGIAVPIFVAFKNNLKKEESSFYSYIELYYEKFVEKLTIIYRLELISVVLIQIVLIICNYPHFNIFKNINLDKVTTLGNLVLAILSLVSSFVIIFCFKTNKKLDKLISFNSANLNSWHCILDIYITVICIIGIVLFFIIKPKNLSYAIAILCVTFVSSLFISGLYTSYVANYVKVRKYYYVDSINMKFSSEEKILTHIINYKLKGDRYIIKINDNGKYRAIEVPISKIEYIEKSINKDKPMILMLQNENQKNKKE